MYLKHDSHSKPHFSGLNYRWCRVHTARNSPRAHSLQSSKLAGPPTPRRPGRKLLTPAPASRPQPDVGAWRPAWRGISFLLGNVTNKFLSSVALTLLCYHSSPP